jgi:mannose-6-phosphate isomerase-like protein (cupin superfamily)
MNVKVLISIVIFVILSLSFLYIKNSNKKAQIWRRRFPEFPVSLFEMACGNTSVSVDNGFDIVKLSDLLSSTNLKSKLCFKKFIGDKVDETNPIISFVKVWINGILNSLPPDVLNSLDNKSFDYNLFISKELSLPKSKDYVDNYFMVLSGTRKIIVNNCTYNLSKGDIIFIPKNTDKTIYCNGDELQIMLNITMGE